MWFVAKPGLDPSGHLGKGPERSVTLTENVSPRKFFILSEYNYEDESPKTVQVLS